MFLKNNVESIPQGDIDKDQFSLNLEKKRIPITVFFLELFHCRLENY